jgi:predicted phosphodiesterase
VGAPQLGPELWRDALAAVAEHGNEAAAARALGMPIGTFRSRHQRALVWQAEGGILPTPPDVLTRPEPIGTYDEARAAWNARLGIAKDRYRGPSKRQVDPARQRVLVLPDIHAPYHHPQMLADAIEAERKADICVVMGDVSDSYALSRFDQSHRAPVEEEIRQVEIILATLSETFPDVRLIRGNHDARLERQLTARLRDLEFIQAIKYMTGGTLDFVQAAARKFPNVQVCGIDAADGQRADWMMVLGDVVFLHAEKFSRVPGSALRGIEEWLSDNERMLGLPPDWRVVIQAHTHQLGMFPYRADKLLVECGCLCQTPGYAVSARVGGRPQRRGYVAFDLVAGRCDVNSVRLQWLDGLERYAS